MAKRIDTKNGRFYEIDGELLPSVTTILQVIAKPYLVPWAAKLERELCLTVADQVFADFEVGALLLGDGVTFGDEIRDRLGRMRAHQKEMDKACDIGSEIHEYIEAVLRRQLYKVATWPDRPDREETAVAVNAWHDWAVKVGLKPLYIEETVYSKRHGYAGTMDTLATLTDERTGERVTALIDWKSSKGLYNEYKLQNAAYAVAWTEMKGRIDVTRGLIVRLPKDPKDKLLKTDRPFELCWVEPANELFPVFQAAQTLWKWQKEK